jgi:hypothetical protein
MKVKTITCPNCGHANNFLAEDCSQCGITFSKYYEELEKAEALRRHIEEQEKAEELKRQQEEEARLLEEKRQQEEAEKAEERRKQQEEEARLEAERQKEAQKRADILRRQKEELEKAEELRRQAEEEARAEEERLRREEEEKAEALRKQQEEEEARLAEERRQQEEEEARAEQERDKPSADLAGPLQMPVKTPDFRSAETMQARLSPYAGQMIGLTYGNPSEIQNVKLISVNDDHFQVYYPITKHVVSYAYRQLMLVTENQEGISAVGPDISPVFPVVIEVPRPFFHQP